MTTVPLLEAERLTVRRVGRAVLDDVSMAVAGHRWKVERSLAWLLANRRLTVRYERRADILTALLQLGWRADLRPQAPTVVNHRYLAVGAASSPDAWSLPARACSRRAAS